MSRILIGSSNVYRFYSAEKYSSYKPYNLVRCVNIETYRARMGCIDPKEKLIIVSVLENFLADAVKNAEREMGNIDGEKFVATICGTIKDFILVLKSAA